MPPNSMCFEVLSKVIKSVIRFWPKFHLPLVPGEEMVKIRVPRQMGDDDRVHRSRRALGDIYRRLDAVHRSVQGHSAVMLVIVRDDLVQDDFRKELADR